MSTEQADQFGGSTGSAKHQHAEHLRRMGITFNAAVNQGTGQL